ncbi:hypothetical protein Ciccas_003434 [Cichlidogyrus casuarinus]|uniref:Uncharacterized protein n=1 Tax=Cichlidogyrus casuarinus TaxID=1844966 RepID=A0ABD2QEE0_9PLAT
MNLTHYLVKQANSSVYELFDPSLQDTCSTKKNGIMRIAIEPHKHPSIMGFAYYLTFTKAGHQMENSVPVRLQKCPGMNKYEYTLCGNWMPVPDDNECIPIGSLVEYMYEKCSHQGMVLSRDCKAGNFTLWFLNEYENSEQKMRKKRIVEKNEKSQNGKWYFIGGLHENQAQYFDFDNWQLKKADNIPDLFVNTAYAAAVSAEGTLFFTGGSTEMRNKYVNTTYLLNADDPDDWKQGPSMLRARAYHSLVYLNGRIYALGGRSSNEFLKTCEYLQVNVTENTLSEWKQCAPMKEARSKFATTVYDGKIYVFGGEVITRTYYKFSGTAERYDPETDSWISLPTMPSKTSSQIAVVFKDKIYVAGGRTFNAYKIIGATKTVDVYDIANNKWKTEFSDEDKINMDPHDPSYLYLLDDTQLNIYKTDPHHFETSLTTVAK